MNGKFVKEIRKNNIKITQEPIVYYWWFKSSVLERLLSKLKSEIDYGKIKTKNIEGVEYSLLYVGKAINGHGRLIKYHILDSSNFHNKGVANGRLSSLRTTLCGLLEMPMSKSQKAINDFIDENCFVEWEDVTDDKLEDTERDRIRQNYLPLNYQNTKGILTSKHRRILIEAKKKMRK